ncbi:MAG: thiol peroxidase [Candidatus Cloacimonas sp.]|nr:thiol peroxidase [Candidatus Cloacimonadota bacterium]
MTPVTFKENRVQLFGNLPEVGISAHPFKLVKSDLSEVTLDSFAGKNLVLNIFPSIDTPVCAAAARKFNEKAESLPNTLVLAISKDLPFALNRYCAAEGLDDIIPLSAFRDSDFGEKYGVLLMDSPLKGLFARAVVVIDTKGKVVYTELVPDIGQEPDYDKAAAALDNLK